MTPTSAGGEQQNYISGGIQSPIWYSLRQDCRDAQKNMSCIAWRASRSKNAEGILESALNRVDIYFSFRLKRSWNILYVICVVRFSSSHSLTCFARVCWSRLAKSSAYPLLAVHFQAAPEQKLHLEISLESEIRYEKIKNCVDTVLLSGRAPSFWTECRYTAAGKRVYGSIGRSGLWTTEEKASGRIP